MSKVKIVMLGPTRAGKTCYMVALYAGMRIGKHGFTFTATDLDVDLKLGNLWETLLEGGGQDRWPPPTQPGNSKKYNFAFNYGLNTLMEFEWFDYRGGAMIDEQKQEDVQKLIKESEDSSCLMICLSGEDLKEKVNLLTASKLQAPRINTLIKKVSEKAKPQPHKPFPVVIVITKYELCKHRNRQDVIEDVKTMFQALFTNTANFLVMICPVSLGAELTDDMGNGKIAPLNVEMPVYFAIYSKFREYAIDKKASRDYTKQRIQSLGGNWWKAFWNSDKIKDNDNQLVDLEQSIDEIQSNMRLISEELKGASLYLNGREVEIDG